MVMIDDPVLKILCQVPSGQEWTHFVFIFSSPCSSISDSKSLKFLQLSNLATWQSYSVKPSQEVLHSWWHWEYTICPGIPESSFYICHYQNNYRNQNNTLGSLVIRQPRSTLTLPASRSARHWLAGYGAQSPKVNFRKKHKNRKDYRRDFRVPLFNKK